MSRALGSSLPEELWGLLCARELPARLGKGILVITTDAAGWPHPALLSYGEVVAVDRHRLRLALDQATRTAENLRRDRKLTLCFIEAGVAYYVKAAAMAREQALIGEPGLAGFEARVEAVLADEARADREPGVVVTGGISYATSRPPAEVLSRWQAVLDELRREP